MDHVTADLHLGHGNILKHAKRIIFMNEEERDVMQSGDPQAIDRLRISQASCDRMDDAIIANINARVAESDRLWILGDFCLAGNASGAKRVALWQKYRERLHCKTICIVWGNHDPKENSAVRAEVSGLFSGAYDLINTKIETQRVTMTHYPMAIWDKRHHGSWHLYGHSHGDAERWLDQIMPGRFSMDVGMDHAYKLLGTYSPFAWPEIAAIMAHRAGYGLRGSENYHHAKAAE